MSPLRKSKCKRNMRGGGDGGSYSFAPSSLGGSVANPLAYSVGSSCMPADSRFGTVVARDFGGIPGVQGSGSPTLVGGRRRTRRGSKGRKGRKGRKGQKGGAYAFANDGTVGGFPGAAGLAGIRYIGPSGPSLSQMPESRAAGILNVPQAGGALVASALGDAYAAPIGGSNMAASVSVPTAGLTHLNGPASIGASSAGVPYMINVPVDGRASGFSPEMHKGGRRSRRVCSSRKARRSKSRRSKSRKSRR